MSYRVVAISDTHSYHSRIEEIPECDLFVCAGDITWRGEVSIIASFADWTKTLPAKRKVAVFGNHEVGLEDPNCMNRKWALKILTDAGIDYLQDSGIEIDGFKIWGSPYTPVFYSWQFMADRGEDIGRHWAQIPDDTNILITHGPPNGILDSVEEVSRGPQGCEMLAGRIKHLPNLKLSVFGHLHREGSRTLVKDGITFVNAAICTDNYAPINKPVVIDL